MGKDYLQEIRTGHILSQYLQGALIEAEKGKYKIAEVRAALMAGLDVAITITEQEIQRVKSKGGNAPLLEKRVAEDKQRKFNLFAGRETTFSNGRIKIPRA